MMLQKLGESLKAAKDSIAATIALIGVVYSGAATLSDYGTKTVAAFQASSRAREDAIMEVNKKLGVMRTTCKTAYGPLEALVDMKDVQVAEYNLKTRCASAYVSIRDQSFTLRDRLEKSKSVTGADWNQSFVDLYDAVDNAGTNVYTPQLIECAWKKLMEKTEYPDAALGMRCPTAVPKDQTSSEHK